MRNQALFRSSFICDCGREHSCPIEKVIIGSGVVHEAAAVLTGIQTALIVSDRNTRPLGGGTPAHLADALTAGKADAALVASMVHNGTYTVGQIKDELNKMGVPMRM